MATIDGCEVSDGIAVLSEYVDDNFADIRAREDACIAYARGAETVTFIDAELDCGWHTSISVAVLREVLRRIDEGDSDEPEPKPE